MGVHVFGRLPQVINTWLILQAFWKMLEGGRGVHDFSQSGYQVKLDTDDDEEGTVVWLRIKGARRVGTRHLSACRKDWIGTDLTVCVCKL